MSYSACRLHFKIHLISDFSGNTVEIKFDGKTSILQCQPDPVDGIIDRLIRIPFFEHNPSYFDSTVSGRSPYLINLLYMDQAFKSEEGGAWSKKRVSLYSTRYPKWLNQLWVLSLASGPCCRSDSVGPADSMFAESPSVCCQPFSTSNLGMLWKKIQERVAMGSRLGDKINGEENEKKWFKEYRLIVLAWNSKQREHLS